MLKKCDFFLQLSGEVLKCVLTNQILSISGLPLHILEVSALWMQHDLGGVIEEDACAAVGQLIAQPILGAVVNPLLHPHFRFDGGRLRGRKRISPLLPAEILYWSDSVKVVVSPLRVDRLRRIEVFYLLRLRSARPQGVLHTSRRKFILTASQILIWILSFSNIEVVLAFVVFAVAGVSVVLWWRVVHDAVWLLCLHDLLPCWQVLLDVWVARGTGENASWQEFGEVALQKGVGGDLIQGGPFGRVQQQDFRDQAAGIVGNEHMVREGVRVHPNFFICRLYVRRLEWGLPNQQRIYDHSQGPHVHFIRMSYFPI